MTYSLLKHVRVKTHIMNEPDISVLLTIIQCFFKTSENGVKETKIEGLEISKDIVSDDLIDNFEELLPLLTQSYNNWQLQRTFEDLNFLKCIKILKHYLFYFGYRIERKDKLISGKGDTPFNPKRPASEGGGCKVKKISMYRIPYNFKKLNMGEGGDPTSDKGLDKSVFRVSFD